jgi:hypothetical protein
VTGWDPFDDDPAESTAEAVVFLGLLALIGLMAIVAGTLRWWRGILPVLLLTLRR